MIRNLMSALTSKGTARAILAGLAIAWGIKILGEIADELQAQIEDQEHEIQVRLEALRELEEQLAQQQTASCPEFVEPPAEPIADHDQARRYLDALVDHLEHQPAGE